MIPRTRYFLYSVVQYVHSRREERLNVGVLVYDPEEEEIHANLDSEHASRRIKTLYPEVDRKGLALYLAGIEESLKTSGHDYVVGPGNPLDLIAAEWQNIVRLTPARPVPATSGAAALEDLIVNYVRQPSPRASAEADRGVRRARARTIQAIQNVLRLDIPHLGYREDFEFDVQIDHKGKRYTLPRHFDFLVQDRFAIDAISLEGPGIKAPESEASLFIAKARDLARESQGTRTPHATVSIDSEDPGLGRSLIAYILEEAGLEDHQVVEAAEAEVMAEGIKRELEAA